MSTIIQYCYINEKVKIEFRKYGQLKYNLESMAFLNA